jgi:hypothetical protein
MDVRGKTILIFGAWGQVGRAICRDLLEHAPQKLVVSSLRESEAREAAEDLGKEYGHKTTKIVPAWGSIFTRQEWKDLPWSEVIGDPTRRKALLSDVLGSLSKEVLQSAALYQLLEEHRPDMVVDCINSATIFAYQDMYSQAIRTVSFLDDFEATGNNFDTLRTQVEEGLLIGAIPQLIRHTQILHSSMSKFGTKAYVKIGTSGTGGMGLNIPYTHSEERPSRVLLTKAAVAGAHTLLLFLMARTPGGPIIKEFKPTAAIAWKEIGYGPIKRRGSPIKLWDLKEEDAVDLGENFHFEAPKEMQEKLATQDPKVLEEVFIDTGENGCFSRSEFEAITTIGQMEFITPEEIAEQVVYEMRGGNTGKDVLDGLDMACMGPTYRAGALRENALSRMSKLEADQQTRSVAFENLGPPRLSKLLYEAHLLKRLGTSLKGILEISPEDLSDRCAELIHEDDSLRSRIVSIGIPILLPDGKRLLRGPEVHIPRNTGHAEIPIREGDINEWADAGWVDLRVVNMKHWHQRAKDAIEEAGKIPTEDTSSRFHRDRTWWHTDTPLDEGRLVGWLFIEEDKGLRMKS